MEIERALETQRHALLRLLAGLVIAVGFVSRGPFRDTLPRWVQSFVHSILRRAEKAAHYLVIVSAWVLTKNGVRVTATKVQRPARARDAATNEPSIETCDAANKPETSPDDLLSTDRLRERMQALRDMLQDLPEHALRLMQKQAKQQSADQELMRPAPAMRYAPVGGGLIKPTRLLLPRVERPPDTS